MKARTGSPGTALNRREFMRALGVAGGGTLMAPLIAAADLNPKLTPEQLVRFPEKTDLILRTDRPPQLETPLHYFREDLTPNDAFYVRWHLEGIPTSVDLESFRLQITGHVDKPLSLSLADLRGQFERFSLIAVNQCSGNSRSFFEPRVPGGQWKNGAMGNARWTGVRLRDLLDRAGAKAGAVDVGFNGLDRAAIATTPNFAKALALDRARDGEVMVAYQMNGADLPMLNGFPLRLVVPGWYATYWVKALTQIQVLPEKFHAPGRDEYMVVCVSCHSPRYVTMQPLFPQRQWEETVDKMAKVYGAQMDQEQRQSIVEYLVTIHGPNSTTGGSPARDEDFD